MRILFFSHYFPPEVNAPAVRTFEHCREWVQCGHEVHVVTCVPSHPQGRVYDGYQSRLRLQRECVEGINVHRVWTYVAANRRFLRRSLGYLSYMISAVPAGRRLPRPDVIVATSPQFFCACAGFLASKLLRRPWLFELRDIWPESIVAVGAMRNRLLIRLLEAIELRLYDDAERIVAVTEAFKANLLRRGVPEGKVEVVPNGIVPDSWAPGDPSVLRSELGLDARFVVSYVGTHGMAHNLDTLLDAAELLRDESDVHVVTVGEGAEFDRLRRTREERGLSNVTMVGQVPHDRAKSYLLASDVLIVLLRKAALFRTVLPSKVFEAMAAGKPIILGVEGEAKRVVESAGAGLCIEPENARELADAVVRLKSDDALRQRLGRSGRAAVRELYDRRVLARRMLDVVEACRASRDGPATGETDGQRCC